MNCPIFMITANRIMWTSSLSSGCPLRGPQSGTGQTMPSFWILPNCPPCAKSAACVCTNRATGALHKVSSPYETVERSEHRAIRYTAETYLTAEDFLQAFADGFTEPWELAEYFDLPEQDVLAAYRFWRDCRGVCFTN